MNDYMVQIALLARQASREANRNPQLNDLADALYALCVRFEVPSALLPK